MRGMQPSYVGGDGRHHSPQLLSFASLMGRLGLDAWLQTKSLWLVADRVRVSAS